MANEYRVYDKKKGEYPTRQDCFALLPDGSLLILTRNGSGAVVSAYPPRPDRYVVERATGMRDRHKKQLFEGDRFLDFDVEEIDPEEGVVFWDETTFGWMARFGRLSSGLEELFSPYIEITGTIHDSEEEG